MQKKHQYEEWEDSNCDGKHQECRRFSTSAKCRFNGRCAYQLTEKNISTVQSEVNRDVANVTIKHEDKNDILKEEMEKMRLFITEMGRQIKTLIKKTTELNNNNETNDEEVIDIVYESISEETEAVKKFEVWGVL